MSYRDKYLKYKNKYKKLKKQEFGILNKKYQNNMEDAILSVYYDKPFAFGKLDIDSNVLNNMKITKNGEYNYFGIFDNKLQDKVIDFIEDLGNNNKESTEISKIINNITKQLLDASNSAKSEGATKKDYVWLALRPESSSIKKYDVPRWHFDGNMYDYNKINGIKERQYKLAISLIGPSTRFKHVDEEGVKKMREYKRSLTLNKEYNPTDINIRARIDKLLEGYDEITYDDCDGLCYAIFALGEVKYALGEVKYAIHSEPPIHEKRLFMSVILGTHENIKQLADKRNREFIDDKTYK